IPFLVLDFKRNFRALLRDEASGQLLVITVGRNTAPLALNMMRPPNGVERNEWIEALADTISTAYLLMQGARNVLKEALLGAMQQHGDRATLRDALGLLRIELAHARTGGRRYGWLESSYRSIEELTKGDIGAALNTIDGIALHELLNIP